MSKISFIKKVIVVILLTIQIFCSLGFCVNTKAQIEDGDTLLLQGDHECDSVIEYWMQDYNMWSYKIVWYVYYQDKDTNIKYLAFCVEPAKQGVGTGYSQYDTYLKKEYDEGIWRILDKGYMGSNYTDWDLECDDDLYSATKVALHSYKEKIAPVDKYIVGRKGIDGNSAEIVARRGTKVLEVSQALYEYAMNGTEKYEEPQIDIEEINYKSDIYDNNKLEILNGIEYLVKEYKIYSNKELIDYDVEIELNDNLELEEKLIIEKGKNNTFKVYIPTEEIIKDVNIIINVKDAKLKTKPIYYCKSSVENAQSYVTYTVDYEIVSKKIDLSIDAKNSNIVITKIDSKTQKPIKDVCFEIKTLNGDLIGNYTTDENGEINLSNLNPGLIIIKEIFCPKEYKLDESEKEISLIWGKIYKLEVLNDPQELKKLPRTGF